MSRQEVSRLKFQECPVLIVTLTVCLIKKAQRALPRMGGAGTSTGPIGFQRNAFRCFWHHVEKWNASLDVAKAFNIVTRAKRYDMMECCSEIHRTC